MSQDEVKQPGLLPGASASTTTTQALLITAAALLLGATIAVLITAASINELKNALVDEAQEEAQRAALATDERIRSVLEGGDSATLEEILREPAVQEQLRLLRANGDVAMACITGPDGRVLFEYFCSKSLSESQCEKARSKVLAAMVNHEPANNPPGIQVASTELDGLPLIPVRRPIARADGQILGEIHLALSNVATLGRINRLSTAITWSLTVMSVMVLLVMAATAAMLHWVFRRHLAVAQRASAGDHLANLGTLAHGLAHDIRNPLQAMAMNLEAVREELEDDSATPQSRAEALHFLTTVQGQVQRLNGTVQDFMKLTVPSRLDLQPLSLDQAVHEAIAAAEQTLRGEDVALQLDAPLPAARVQADPKALRQVLDALLENARTAVQNTNDKRIHVRLHGVRRGWEVSVEDSGPGIPPESRTELFRCFKSKASGGTGMGLSLARQIAESHGGSIRAECPKVLSGARVVVRLPGTREE